MEQAHTSNQTYRCFRCYELFNNVDTLYAHLIQETCHQTYMCDFCHNSFTSLEICTLHVVSHIKDETDSNVHVVSHIKDETDGNDAVVDDTCNGQKKETSNMVYLDRDVDSDILIGASNIKELNETVGVAANRDVNTDILSGATDINGNWRKEFNETLDVAANREMKLSHTDVIEANVESKIDINNQNEAYNSNMKIKIEDDTSGYPDVDNKAEVQKTNQDMKIDNEDYCIIDSKANDSTKDKQIKTDNEDYTEMKVNYNGGEIQKAGSGIKLENDPEERNTYSEMEVSRIDEVANDSSIYNVVEVKNTCSNNENRITTMNANYIKKLEEAVVMYHETMHKETVRKGNSEQKNKETHLNAGMSNMAAKGRLTNDATHATMINGKIVDGVKFGLIQRGKIITVKTDSSNAPKNRLGANCENPQGNTSKQLLNFGKYFTVSKPTAHSSATKYSLCMPRVTANNPAIVPSTEKTSVPEHRQTVHVELVKLNAPVTGNPSLNTKIGHVETQNNQFFRVITQQQVIQKIIQKTHIPDVSQNQINLCSEVQH